MRVSRLIADGNPPSEWKEFDPPPPGWVELVLGILRTRDITKCSRGESLGLVDLMANACDTGCFDFEQAHAILAHRDLEVHTYARVRSQS